MAVGASVELRSLRKVYGAVVALDTLTVFLVGTMEVLRRQAAIRVPMS